MTELTKYPSNVLGYPGWFGGTNGTLITSYTNAVDYPNNLMTWLYGSGTTTYTYGFAWDATLKYSASNGEAIPSSNFATGWSSPCPYVGTMPTPTQVNNTDTYYGLALGVYYTSGGNTKDVWDLGFGFSIPEEATVTGLIGQFAQARGVSITAYIYLNCMKLTVAYTSDNASSSPTSNAYGSPLMFRCPTDLLNILKKPLWEQTSHSHRIIM